VREALARQKTVEPMPPVIVRTTVRHSGVDVEPARPTVSAPPRASAQATSPVRPEAPDLLNKLKRIFWQ
jgi:hypothetical protein